MELFKDNEISIVCIVKNNSFNIYKNQVYGNYISVIFFNSY